MKSSLLVILPAGCASPEASLREMLEHFRLDEDSLESIRSHHWDYWTYPESFIAQPDVAASFPDLDPDLAGNLGRVEALSRTEYWCGVITPELRWRDLRDHGWRMIKHPCPENAIAEKAWLAEYAAILDRYPGHLAAGVIIHC